MDRVIVKYTGIIVLMVAGITVADAALVGHWKLDETANPSGNTIAADSSGNGLVGVYQPRGGSGPILAQDGAREWTGTSADFNGVDDEVYLGHPTNLNNIVKNFTVMAWIKPDDLSGIGRIFARNPPGEGWGFGKSGAKLLFTTWSRKDFVSTDSVLVTGKWQHVSVTFKENTPSSYVASFYLNAAFVERINDDRPASGGTAKNWFIGSHGSGERFNGSIDDVRIYDHVMTADEMAQVVFDGEPFHERSASVVFEYKFPRSFNGTSTAIRDTGYNNHHGTMDSTNGYSAAMKPPGMSGGSLSGADSGYGRTDEIDLLNTADVEAYGGFKMQTWFYWTGLKTYIQKLVDYAGTEYIMTRNSEIHYSVSNGGIILKAPIVSNRWYFAEAYFDTDGNTKEADAAHAGDYKILGHAYLYLDGELVASAANVTKDGFGDKLDRPTGLNRWANGTGDLNDGYIYNPSVYLGVGQPPPPPGMCIILR